VDRLPSFHRVLIAMLFMLSMIVGLTTPAMAVDIAGPEQVAAYKMIDHSLPNPAVWEIKPESGVDMRQAQDGKSITWVAPPGKYQIVAIIVKIDFEQKSWTIQKASREVVISGSNPPNPPTPEPQPVPGVKYQVAFLVESGNLDNLPQAQRALLASLTLRDEVTKRGHHFLGVLETDQSKTAPQALAPFYAATEGKPLPRVAIAPLAGGTITEFALPANESAFWKSLGESQ
jgi:hypothetical protein